MSKILYDIWKKEFDWTSYNILPEYPAWKQIERDIYSDTFILDSHYNMFNWSKHQSGITYRYIHPKDDLYEINTSINDDLYSINNYFSPYQVIDNYYININPVDIVCDFNVYTTQNHYKLDNYKLNVGNKVALINQNNKYQNGIYVINKNFFLERTNDLENEEKSYRYQLYCKSGTNKNQHFYLVPDSNGRFPIDGEILLFKKDRGLILKSLINYDIYNTGQTQSTSSKIVYTDIDIARKNLTLNANLYEGFQLSGSSIQTITPFTMSYKNMDYDVAYSTNISKKANYFRNGVSNIYNYNGETYVDLNLLGSNFPLNVGDYINLRIEYNDINNPFLDNSYFNINTFIKRIVNSYDGLITITDIIPDYILNIIGVDFDGWIINPLSGQTIYDYDELLYDDFSQDLGWELSGFTINTDSINLLSSTTNSYASQYLWNNATSGSTIKLTYFVSFVDISGTTNDITGATYLSGTTGIQKISDITTLSRNIYEETIICDSNDYDRFYIEFEPTNIIEINIDYIKLEESILSVEIDSGLTSYYTLEKNEYTELSSITFYEEEFDDVGTWNLSSNMNISGGTLNLLSGSTSNQTAFDGIGSLFNGSTITISFDYIFSGNTIGGLYLSGSTDVLSVLSMDYNTYTSGTTNNINIDIDINGHDYNNILFEFLSGSTGATIDNLIIDIESSKTYPNLIKDEISNEFATGQTLSQSDGVFKILRDNIIIGEYYEEFYSLYFNGTNSYINLPKNKLNSNLISVSIWFKTEKNGTIIGHQDALLNNNTEKYIPICYVGYDGKVRFQYGNGDIDPIISSKKYNDNIWHNLIFTINNSSQTLYIDTTIIGTKNIDLVVEKLNFNQLGVGYAKNWPNTNNSWFYFNGSLDEFGIWNREISYQEIKYIFNNGKGSTLDTSSSSDVELTQSDIDKYSYYFRNYNFTNNQSISLIESIEKSYFNDFITTDIELLGTNTALTFNILSFLDDEYVDSIDFFESRISGDWGPSFGDRGYSGFISWSNNDVTFSGMTTGITDGEFYSNSFSVSKGEKLKLIGTISEISSDDDNIINYYNTNSSISLSSGNTINILSGYSYSDGTLILYDLNQVKETPSLGSSVDGILTSYFSFNSLSSTTDTGNEDEMSNNYLENYLVSIKDGIIKNSYYYDGFESYSRIVNPETIRIPSGQTIKQPSSISLWFKTDTIGVILSNQDASLSGTPTEYNPIIYIGFDGKIRGGFSKEKIIATTSNIIDNEWHNIIITISDDTDNTQTMYLDGVFVDSISGNTTDFLPKTGFTYTYLGAGYAVGYDSISTNNNFYFQGSIDELSTWNVVLEQSKVDEIYNNGFGSSFDTDEEILPYFLSDFSTSDVDEIIIKSNSFLIEDSEYWYKLELNLFDILNMESLEISLVNNNGNRNSILVSENGNLISNTYKTTSLSTLQNTELELIFSSLNSGISYIEYKIKPLVLSANKSFNSYNKLYLYDNIKLIFDIRDNNMNSISDSIIVSSVGDFEYELTINDNIPESISTGFLFGYIQVNGTPKRIKTLQGEIKLQRIIQDFNLNILPKNSDCNRYFYYDQFRVTQINDNYILNEDGSRIELESGDGYILLEDGSGITEKYFSRFNNYVDYIIQPFLYNIWTGFTENYQIYNNDSISYQNFTWNYYNDIESKTLKFTFDNNVDLSNFNEYTYIQYASNVNFSLILEIGENYMIVEKPYNFSIMTSTDMSFSNVNTLGQISDLIKDNYLGYSNMINVNNMDICKKISDSYAKIIEKDENIQKHTTGIIYGSDKHKYIFKIFNVNDDKLYYEPIEYSVIGVDKKYRFPIQINK